MRIENYLYANKKNCKESKKENEKEKKSLPLLLGGSGGARREIESSVLFIVKLPFPSTSSTSPLRVFEVQGCY